MSGAQFDAARTRMLTKIGDDVARVGWSSIGVFPTVDDDQTQQFMYSIGLPTTLDHPELIVYGLPYRQAHAVLFSAIEEIRRGAKLEPGTKTPNVLEGYDVLIRETDPLTAPHTFAVVWSAVAAAGPAIQGAAEPEPRIVDAVPPIVQVVWPDNEGRFPGDPDCDPATVADQEPVLYDRTEEQ
ncbi:MAG TPA: DUF4262 domain-containing protein [Gaiellaceae bacterium]|jgi:hypothetical protein|nr:DUF4262 domain-containing protein [Gaiellaceae bacterium]